MAKSSTYIWKLGLFVLIGISFFIVSIYFIGKNKNLFDRTFRLRSHFQNVSGLKVGNNVRFSGINVGTVKGIHFLSDTLVEVDLLIKEEIQPYIKKDAQASIGTDGLMGDKVLIILPGTPSNEMVEENAIIVSIKSIEFEDLIKSLNKSIQNAQIITQQLTEFSIKINKSEGPLNTILTDKEFAKQMVQTMNNLKSSSDEFAVFSKNLNTKKGSLSQIINDPEYAESIKKAIQNLENSTKEIEVFSKKLNDSKGILSKLIDNEQLAISLDTSLTNIEKGTKNLLELEEAAKHNFLLKGYFKKKEKESKQTKPVHPITNKKNIP
ncbi:MlaD family protein [Flavobacterium sp. RSSA_27]|uniref:MlaD family protein n=1 Tax=Flavobacterium sp. RSSA_27 TaxID=3447667 RepID=UPI003F3B6A43